MTNVALHIMFASAKPLTVRISTATRAGVQLPATSINSCIVDVSPRFNQDQATRLVANGLRSSDRVPEPVQ